MSPSDNIERSGNDADIHHRRPRRSSRRKEGERSEDEGTGGGKVRKHSSEGRLKRENNGRRTSDLTYDSRRTSRIDYPDVSLTRTPTKMPQRSSARSRSRTRDKPKTDEKQGQKSLPSIAKNSKGKMARVLANLYSDDDTKYKAPVQLTPPKKSDINRPTRKAAAVLESLYSDDDTKSKAPVRSVPPKKSASRRPTGKAATVLENLYSDDDVKSKASVRSKPPKESDSNRSAGNAAAVFENLYGKPKQKELKINKQATCSICYTEDKLSHMKHMSCCNTRWCKSCTTRIFRHFAQDFEQYPSCCRNKIDFTKLAKTMFNQPQDSDFVAYVTERIEEYRTKDVLHCAAPGCGQWIKKKEVHDTGKVFGTCPKEDCRKRTCNVCRLVWKKGHGSTKCQSAQDEITKSLDERSRPCSHCNQIIVMEPGGCNEVKCRCGWTTCFKCGNGIKNCACR